MTMDAHLVLLCSATRVLVASHVLATCATVHVTPLILSLRAWGGRVGDSQSDGGDFSFRTKVFARFPHTTAHARAPRLVPHCWHRVAVELRLSAAGALHACYAVDGVAVASTELAGDELAYHGVATARGHVGMLGYRGPNAASGAYHFRNVVVRCEL